MACACLLAGITGYFVANAGGVWLIEPLRSQIPADKRIYFLVDLWSHSAAYGVGILGGVVLCVRIVFRRRRAGGNEFK
jgi:hypothetical protein